MTTENKRVTAGHHAELAASDIETADPERLSLVPVLLDETGETDAEPRFVLVRWPDWPPPAMLSMVPPGAYYTLADAAASLLDGRLRLTVAGEPRIAARRIPVRMPAPRMGLNGTGWLRAVLVPVSGTPEPDSLLDGFVLLTRSEALATLSTEVERMLLQDAADLL